MAESLIAEEREESSVSSSDCRRSFDAGPLRASSAYGRRLGPGWSALPSMLEACHFSVHRVACHFGRPEYQSSARSSPASSPASCSLSLVRVVQTRQRPAKYGRKGEPNSAIDRSSSPRRGQQRLARRDSQCDRCEPLCVLSTGFTFETASTTGG